MTEPDRGATRPSATGIQFWFALVFSFLLGMSGMFILVTDQGTELRVIGWVLVIVGSLFLALNLALRQRPR